MTVFLSPFHNCYVAQYTHKGTLYTGRGDSFNEAIYYCLRSVSEYIRYA